MTKRCFLPLFHAHILPKPYLKEGRFLAQQDGVHAAIDVSDGLSSDISHIAEESHVGIRLYADKIPISKNLHNFCRYFGFNPIEYALSGGEDYTLLCTISLDKEDQILKKYFDEFHQPLYPFGEITENSDIREIISPDGQTKTFTPSGWDHFR